MSSASCSAPPPNLAAQPRVPEAIAGIQVNFCKNPTCANFGVPVPQVATKGQLAHGGKNPYALTGSTFVGGSIRCNVCGEHSSMKSNLGVFEEAWRVSSETFREPCCPVPLCGNHQVPVSTKGAYHRFGMTMGGSARFRCRACGKTFSTKPAGRNPIARQIRSDKNPMILSMLANKMPLRRICEAVGIAPRVLYDRIDFFHQQALGFLAERESKLPQMGFRRLYIGVDRQDYAVNWTHRKDRRNVVVSAVASADNLSGYVFAMNPNFDPEAAPEDIGREAARLGDSLIPPPHRRFARLWLEGDFREAVASGAQRRARPGLLGEIAGQYDLARQRDDAEAPEAFTRNDKLPRDGMLVHGEYTLWGHFLHLGRLLPGAEKLRFFLDMDAGMRAACLGAFAGRIKDRSVDALFVRISKELTIDQKRALVAGGAPRIRRARKGPSRSDGKPDQATVTERTL